jgi:molybdopterin synthase catalytic subunit
VTTDVTGAVVFVDISEEELSVDECIAAVRRPSAGGLAVFIGTVRERDHGRDVAELEYSAHPDALAALRRTAEAVATEPGVQAVAAVHRVGVLAIGDLAVVVAVAGAHRPEAFTAARALIDQLKATVPIWKRQVYADGEVEWVGCR